MWFDTQRVTIELTQVHFEVFWEAWTDFFGTSCKGLFDCFILAGLSTSNNQTKEAENSWQKCKVNQIALSSNHDTSIENWAILKQAWRCLHYWDHRSQFVPPALLFPEARKNLISQSKFQVHSQLLC